MITATVKYNDNYTDIEFPCSEAYLSAKLMEIHVDDLSSTTRYISAITEPKELSFLKDIMSCVWLDYMVKYFQCKNCVGSSPKTKKCVASFLVPVYRKKHLL